MTEPSKAKTPALRSKDRIIVALDLETAEDARRIVGEIRDDVGAFKVGLQLFAAAGPRFVRELVDSQLRVFLDLKFHDIPNTVAAASVEAARLGVWMFNLHASGGREMMIRSSMAVRESCTRDGLDVPIMIAVTLLTSSNSETLAELGFNGSVEEYVSKLAGLAAASGLDGVVASPLEADLIKRSVKSDDFIVVTPGVRPINETHDDQKRVMTPAEALAAGSDYLVIGRPVTAVSDKVAAVRRIIDDIDKAN